MLAPGIATHAFTGQGICSAPWRCGCRAARPAVALHLESLLGGDGGRAPLTERGPRMTPSYTGGLPIGGPASARDTVDLPHLQSSPYE